MENTRAVRQRFRSTPTIEGAGVHLKRAFGFGQVPLFDPFLMLDDFHGVRSEQYIKGFPWHPHRGIETITYVLHGTVAHGDSMGNQGVIGAGDVQWMTAGSGIIHQEMPKGEAGGLMWGFQLWANLPAARKMMDPRYREVKKEEIPVVRLDDGAEVRVICGEVEGRKGPVRDIVIDPQYLDVTLPPAARVVLPVNPGHTTFAYVFEGAGGFGNDTESSVARETLVLFGDGSEVAAAASEQSMRFLLVSGRPLGEPVAWRGPIVMNTEAELETAFEEVRHGTFTRHRRS
jgi:hypothetical protein